MSLGGAVETGRCTNCGFENPNDSKFCGRCGNVLQATYGPNDFGRPKPKKRLGILVILIVVAITIVMILSAVALTDSNKSNGTSKLTLYVHISFSVIQMATPSPLVTLSVDFNGDGKIETARDYYPLVSIIGDLYTQTSIKTLVVMLDSSSSTFSYRIQVWNGTSTLDYFTDQPYDTFNGSISDGSANTWNFTPSMTDGQHCQLLTEYQVNSLSS